MATANEEVRVINLEEIYKEKEIGNGTFGVVYKARWNNRDVAVKEFLSDNMEAIQKEIKQLSRVEKHDNIIELLGVCQFRQNLIYLVMEYADCGSFHDFLHNSQYKYTESHAISWLCQCAQGVAYLHGMKPKPVLHRDLKPGNLLLINNYKTLKIADFGTVAELKTLMTKQRGSPLWMAPEVFIGNKYTEKCDVYSWGIIVWEVFNREVPYKEFTNFFPLMDAVIEGRRPPIAGGCSQINKLMTDCWDGEPSNRPSMEQVLQRIRDLSQLFNDADIRIGPEGQTAGGGTEEMFETVIENIQKKAFE